MNNASWFIICAALIIIALVLADTLRNQKGSKKWYREVYLKSDHWLRMSDAVKRRDMWNCQVSGCNNHQLTVHHIVYNLYVEKMDELITLCWKHHKMTHRGIPLNLRGRMILRPYRKHK